MDLLGSARVPINGLRDEPGQGHHRPFMPPSPSTSALALANVLSPTTKRRSNGRSLDQQWEDLASFLRGAGSVLATWLALHEMHSLYVEMMGAGSMAARRANSQTVGHFIERACRETGLSRQSVYNYVERAKGLVEALGPSVLKIMLSGGQTISNDENLLIKLAQLPPRKALKVVEVYMRGGKGEVAAAKLVERYIHAHRLTGLSSHHEPELRGGSLREELASKEKGRPEVRSTVLFGDALVHLQETLLPESVQTCITSPPFFGQRDFGTRHWFGGDADCKHGSKSEICSKCGSWFGQLGQESDVGTYIQHLVTIFREVWRVLREGGTCWIEIGDTFNAYNASRGASRGLSGRVTNAITYHKRWSNPRIDPPSRSAPTRARLRRPRPAQASL
jgi:hypothetical protein